MASALYGDRLYTPRLHLRRIQAVDLPLVCRWSRDAVACGVYLTPEEYSQAQLAEQLRNGALWRNQERLFLIDRRADRHPLGTIHYWKRQDLRDTAVMAVKIALPDQRSQGYGTEAQKYLLIHLFKQVGVGAVEMYTDVDNHPQQRCLNKLGFQVERSLTYVDLSIERTGHLFRLTADGFARHPVFHYHYD
jgi:RimJ/RimL family protein N-acetyltransferase